jgi:uncharacterized protein
MADKPDDQPADRYPDSEGPFAGPNNTFPLNTEARVRNAWARIHQGPTRANHTAAEIADIMGKIKARAKELGIELEDSSAPGAARSAPSDDAERRFTFTRVELRAGDEDGAPGREIFGYAAVFGSPSRNLGYFVERSAPTFLDKACADGWPGAGAGVVCRYNHSDDYLLGTTRGGTLKLSLDNKGLKYSAILPETRSDVRELAARGDLNGSSYAMVVNPDGGCEWSYDDTGVVQRTLLEAQLIDVAPVGAPAAYPSATVGLRSLARQMHASLEEVEELARQDELRRFFVRTDVAPPPPVEAPAEAPSEAPAEERQLELDLPQPMSPAVALMHMQGRRYAEPITTSQ